MKVAIGEGKAALTISPNPAKAGQVNLQLTNFAKGIYTINLFNASGQKVFSDQIKSEGDSSSQTLHLPAGVKPGTYNLLMNNNADVRFAKTLVIQ